MESSRHAAVSYPFDFEVFVPAPTVEPDPTITFRDDSLILSGSAHRVMGSPSTVELLYDRSKRMVGVRATSTGGPQAFTVRTLRSADGSVMVASPEFLRWSGVAAVGCKWTVRAWFDAEQSAICTDLSTADA